MSHESYQVVGDVLTYGYEFVLAVGLIATVFSFVLFCMEKMAGMSQKTTPIAAVTDRDGLYPLVSTTQATEHALNGQNEEASAQKINLKGVKIYKLHKRDTVRVADLPCEVPNGVSLRKLRKEDAVYLRDLRAVATLVGV